MIERRHLIQGAVGLLAGGLTSCQKNQDEPLRLFVTKSLQPIIEQLQREGEPLSGTVSISAGSQSIARQIEATRRGDIVITADEKWLDWLCQKGLVHISTKSVLLRNQLVLAAHRDSEFSLPELKSLESLPFRTLFIGDPKSVPAGRYAQAALRDAQLLNALAPRIQTTIDVRAALSPLAARTDLLAMVYSTDVARVPEVKTIYRFPEERPRIEYFCAALTSARSVERTQAILTLLKSPAIFGIFLEAGFLPPGPSAGARA